jgi:serine/threonine protein phosphatase PrpC
MRAVSQRADLVPVAPEEGAVRLTVGVAGGGDGSAVAGERLPIASSTDETWLMAAVAGEGQETTAARVVSDLRNALSQGSLDDAGAAMKQAFRAINSALYQQGMGSQTASAVALITRGKYATIANVGDGRAYLMRAGRLNQVTRDITPTPMKAGKGKNAPAEEPKSAAPALLGSRDRLDSRQPAIYELTLLPEDRVLLCTAAMYRAMDEQALVANLADEDVERSLALLRGASGPSGAVVATVAAARVREPVLVTSEGQTSALPLVAALVVVVLLVVAYIVYAMFL